MGRNCKWEIEYYKNPFLRKNKKEKRGEELKGHIGEGISRKGSQSIVSGSMSSISVNEGGLVCLQTKFNMAKEGGRHGEEGSGLILRNIQITKKGTRGSCTKGCVLATKKGRELRKENSHEGWRDQNSCRVQKKRTTKRTKGGEVMKTTENLQSETKKAVSWTEFTEWGYERGEMRRNGQIYGRRQEGNRAEHKPQKGGGERGKGIS